MMKMPQERRQRAIGYYLFFYFGIMHVLVIVQMLSGRNFRVFWIVDSVAVFSISLSLVYIGRYLKTHAGKLAKPDFFVLAYLGWSLFSVFFYLQKGNPASWTAFFYGIHYLVFPIFLYFSVKRLDWSFQEPLLKNICYLNVFLSKPLKNTPRLAAGMNSCLSEGVIRGTGKSPLSA